MKIGKDIKRVKSPARRTRKHNQKAIPAFIPWPLREKKPIGPVIITGS